MAEAQGFEPWEDFHPRRFSRPVHSTTLPNLRPRSLSGKSLIRKAGSCGMGKRSLAIPLDPWRNALRDSAPQW